MTFRAKPVVKRTHRPSWETQDRRNLYLNLGFGLIVVLAVVILAIAAGISYYNDHLVSVGSVDGQSISKDELRDRVSVDAWRLAESDRRIQTEVVAGQLTDAQATTQKDANTQQRNQIATLSLEHIIDAKIQAKLATDQGVSVTPQDVDAKLVVEATTPESRHAWVIEVAPAIDPGAVTPTAAQTAAAQAKANQALADITGGKKWEDVAKTVSTDAATATQAGDLGWIQADDATADEAFLKAVFAAPVNTPTAVVVGSDGIFRIGRVTEIAASSVDTAYQAKIQNDGVNLDTYRAVVAADVLHQKLEDKIVADVTAAGPQRRVSEIYVSEAAPNLLPDAVKVRHILYSPNGDPNAASTLPATDPAWEVAHAKALATYVKLKENPSLFDSVARAESDEAQARGLTGSGGKLPFFDSSSSVDTAFRAAITLPGLKDGDILEPVKSAFGWHVIQIMYHPTDLAHLQALKAQADAGTDFAVLARDTSVAPSAGIGGDLGWVAKGQLDDKLIAAIFATPIGKTSDIVTIAGDGSYLFKVTAEETRTPEGRQLDQLKATAFTTYYDAKKKAAVIYRDPSTQASPTQ
jgi:parvulin-like peptidyl-prolyl isomerase